MLGRSFEKADFDGFFGNRAVFKLWFDFKNLEIKGLGLVLKFYFKGNYMEFSNRTPRDLSFNPISSAQDRLEGTSLLDLTQSNPTQCGFNYPSNLLETLGKSRGLFYEPEPFGHSNARQAVADYLSRHGPPLDPSNVILTASTSEAYSFIFKLLGNPGDRFLVPAPGYPLLDHLLCLEGLESIPYFLKKEPGWPLDRDPFEKALRQGTKGLITVNPHNPTGCFLSLADQSFLTDQCRQNSMAFLSDEVFSDFAFPGQGSGEKPTPDILSFRLGGLSKSLGLPQLKLSWIVMEGPAGVLAECRARMELIADTYLSVNTPVQLALGDLLKFAPIFREQVLSRVLENLACLERTLADLPDVKVWPVQGGWYALVEVLKPGVSEEQRVIDLLEKQGVWVHPGGFYDFPQGNFLVLSLLPAVRVFEEAAGRIKKSFRV